MLRILYDDFDQKIKNIHDEMDLRNSYKKKGKKKAFTCFPIILIEHFNLEGLTHF